MGKISRRKALIETNPKNAKERDLESSKKTINSHREKKRKRVPDVALFLPILIIIAVSVAVYFNALFNGFVYDDAAQILNNRWITDMQYIPEIFSSGVWGFLHSNSLGYYRPLMHVIYMVSYHFFGFTPWGFHLVNVLFHGGVAVLVFATASVLINSRSPVFSLYSPFTAALLFATHPIHTEAVTWLAGVPELSFTFFFLSSFYFYAKRTDNDSYYKVFSILSVALFFLSTLCKETALILPLILVIYDYLFQERPSRPLRQFARYVPYAVVIGIYLLLRINALGGLVPRMQYPRLSTYEYVLNVFPLFMQYLEKLIFPINLNVFYVFHPIKSILEVRGILSLVTTLGFITLLFAAAKKDKIFFFSLFMIAAPLLPVFYIRGLGVNPFTERYLYLPSVGFVIVVALLLDRVRRNKPFRNVSFVAFLLVVGLYSMGTLNRNAVWKDNYALFSDTVKKSPDGATPHYNLANAYHDKGLIDKAIEHYKTALALNPDHVEARDNLGSSYLEKGLINEAIEQYLAVLKLRPDLAEAHYNLGSAYLEKGLINEAIEQYLAVLKLRPDLAEAHYNLGLAYIKKGLKSDAIGEFKQALHIRANFSEARQALEIITK